ncbi:MJ0042-type zinc finger domain-containing protein [Brevundimonas subvibrioides]|uniref:MJ0042 family finger-like protein n=1 Tax=Brevundimonas subvibrioides (strain ATCC 15264 / DSM 4735 / LMG 14903 / NBRC 16000 / CB 81) TaxID=633149 RepID=D9QG64_BRESC|nr:MJ0042-type zinc finger domain-containing protein [Brevundimonas subvibrioides]ADL02606.1 MJ0042 family finger-like protein [Brevundimonas subvibrioides ATCC 15264]
MILTCPSCATSYFTPDGAIPPTGRKVRCQSCAHVWLATVEEPLELTTETSPPVEARSFEPEPVVAPETPAPELPKAFRARAEQQRRLRRAATHGVVWAGLASLFVGLIGAGWLFRVDVVQMYPRAAAAYAMVGSPVNAVGLEFEAVTAKALPDRPDTVVVSGALRNVRDREIVAPAVRVALLDDHGAEIGHAVIRLEEAPVLPGGVQGFAALIRDPGAHGVDVGVAFVGSEPAGHGESSAAASGHGSPPRSRPLPTPDEHGLRPALIEAAPAAHTQPVDAAPVVEEHHDTVDTHGAEAVSASHG